MKDNYYLINVYLARSLYTKTILFTSINYFTIFMYVKKKKKIKNY